MPFLRFRRRNLMFFVITFWRSKPSKQVIKIFEKICFDSQDDPRKLIGYCLLYSFSSFISNLKELCTYWTLVGLVCKKRFRVVLIKC